MRGWKTWQALCKETAVSDRPVYFLLLAVLVAFFGFWITEGVIVVLAFVLAAIFLLMGVFWLLAKRK